MSERQLLHAAAMPRNTSTVTAVLQSKAADRLTAASAVKGHWPEYLMEAAELGFFMVSACFFTTLLEYPASPVRYMLPSAFLRHALSGLAMALTLLALIHSGWGKRSGAHMNPAMTLMFFRLGKVEAWDGIFHVVGQFVGGFIGVFAGVFVDRPATRASERQLCGYAARYVGNRRCIRRRASDFV